MHINERGLFDEHITQIATQTPDKARTRHGQAPAQDGDLDIVKIKATHTDLAVAMAKSGNDKVWRGRWRWQSLARARSGGGKVRRWQGQAVARSADGNKQTKQAMATKFYRCRHCGNVIQKLVDSKVPVVCCGEKMEELIPNTVDASNEKHVPVVTFLDGCTLKVEVGSVPHPMTPEHHICFIYVETENGGQRFDLTDSPRAKVCTCKGRPIAVYEYCNLHGLWKTEL